MSFLSGNTDAAAAPEARALGVQPELTSSNEQARAVPYLAGKTRMGLHWLNEPFGVRTEAVESAAGKDRKVTTGHNYYASIAGLLCLTGGQPLAALHKIYFNGDEVWSGDLARGVDEDSAPVTIEGFGNARIYWGTATQDVDATLTASGNDHPPYRRQAYLVFTDIFLGFNQTNLHNVELVVSRYPDPSWFTAAATVEEDANPAAVLADLLQCPVCGLGLADAEIDAASFNAAGATLATEGAGVSPYITRSQPARQLATELLAYIDGYLYRTAAGTLALGLVREPADWAAVPAIDADDLAAAPELEPQDWSGVTPRLWVRFTDRSRDWRENSLPWRDRMAFEASGSHEAQTVQRPWITRPAYAQAVTAALGRQGALPSATGSLQVLRSAAAALTIGAAFKLSFSDQGLADVQCRVTARRTPGPESGIVEIVFRLDRSALNAAYHLPADNTPPDPAVVTPAAFTSQAILELPAALSLNGQVTLAPIAARPNKLTVGYRVHLQSASQFWSVSTQGVIGTNIVGLELEEDYPTAAATDGGAQTGFHDFTTGMLVSLTSGTEADMTTAIGAGKFYIINEGEHIVIVSWKAEGDNYRLYGVRNANGGGYSAHTDGATFFGWEAPTAVFTSSFEELGTSAALARHGTTDEAYAVTPDLDTAVGVSITLDNAETTLVSVGLDEQLAGKWLMFIGAEIISVGAVTLLAAGQYRVYGLRGRYDTRAAAHDSGSEVWIIEASKLQGFTNVRFGQGQTLTFKLQPLLAGGEMDLSAVSSVIHQVTNRVARPLAPRNLRANADGQNPFFTTGQDVELSWSNTTPAAAELWTQLGAPTTSGLPATRLEFLTTGDVVKRTVDTAAGAAAYTYDNADLLADFVSEQTFKVRATALNGSALLSTFSEELTIYFQA